MITKVKNNIEISYGKYWACLEGTKIPIGNDAMGRYREYEDEINFIQNPRIRMYVLIKMIFGNTFEEALNKVIDKIHLFDPDYRSLIY